MEKNKDFKIERTMGTGPGGQHKNRTYSKVVITHIPSGLSVSCQETRSYHQNLKKAKKQMLNKIKQFKEQKKLQQKQSQRNERIKNQTRIRTYNFITKTVIDHRTKKKANLDEVLNKGNLDLLR